jgi:hypothetical protein
MKWWDVVYGTVTVGDSLFTPGRGLDGGNKRKPFRVIKKLIDRINVQSGAYLIPLDKACFDAIEEAFTDYPHLWLRVASIKEIPALSGSADELIRKRTGSNLARGNYVCSILEYCGLVRYAMEGNRKGIVLPEK